MKQPIFVYYQLDNFYQNHRRYVKSHNDGQLRDRSKENDTTNCDPETTVDGRPIVPCGLIACSLFNYMYTFFRNSKNLTVDKKDISWKSDRDLGSDVFPKYFQEGALIGGKALDPLIPLSKKTLLFGCERQHFQHSESCMVGFILVSRKMTPLQFDWKTITTPTALVARRRNWGITTTCHGTEPPQAADCWKLCCIVCLKQIGLWFRCILYYIVSILLVSGIAYIHEVELCTNESLDPPVHRCTLH